MVRTGASMCIGWSPTGTFVMSGRFTIVIFNTCGENIFSHNCFSEISLLLCSSCSVSECTKERKKEFCERQSLNTQQPPFWVHSKPKLGPCFYLNGLVYQQQDMNIHNPKTCFFQQCWHLIDREGSIFDADKFSPGFLCGLLKIRRLATRKV